MPEIVDAPDTATIGALLRQIAATDTPTGTAMALRMVGALDVQLARTGDRWRLYLQSMLPVPHGACDVWATAVGAPSVEWDRTPDGCLTWCEWRE